jgi:alkylation response protein AidB-like acyl-CoA dehydrogenase
VTAVHTPAASFTDTSVGLFRSQVRDWLQRVAGQFEIPEGAAEDKEIEIRRAWEREAARAGYSCLSWPVRFGGRGLGPIEDFVFAEECIAAGVPEPLGRVGRLLTGPAIFVHGSPEMKARFLPRIVAGEDIWCQGFSEPNAGSDLAGVQAAARRDGDRYLITGQKIWTSFGHYADWCLLIARTDQREKRHRGLTMFALPMHQAGVELRNIVQITGKAEFNEVFFDQAEVPADCVIGEEGQGWQVAMTVLTAERGAGFAALALKTMADVLVLLEHCTADRPDLRPRLDQLRIEQEMTRFHIMRSIERMASDRNPGPSAGIMKLVWSELTQELIRFGFETDCPQHRDRWRFLELDIRSDTIASGSSEIQRNIISERVLGLPR